MKNYGEAQEISELLQKGLIEGITVDLREPSYSDGILSTDKGGIITASQIRIQALHLNYRRKTTEGQLQWTVEAEGDLIIEFGEYIFVGQKLFYNFQTKEGRIYQGKTAVEPWHFGGEILELRSDGSYVIYNGYVTTSEKDSPDWGIYSQEIILENNNHLEARRIHIKVLNYTVLWIPSLRINLDAIFDNPIRYRFRWGGRQGPRFGLTYEIFSWQHWKTFVRFDYRLTRGPGGGVETRYHSLDGKTEFQSINYVASDSSILHPHDKARYRFEGVFKKLMDEDKTSILFTYDRISDKDMPSNYYDRDFDFDTAERTQLRIRRQENQWITNFYTRVRINSFQTVKQELPSLEVNLKPFEIKHTGLIFENWASASYLDFKYSKYLLHVHNYASTRFDYQPTLYRPFQVGKFLAITPEIGMINILYGESPQQESQWLALGKVGCKLQTQLYRYYGLMKHMIEPYAYYRYYSSPTFAANQHYIFTIEDGWARLNYLSFGVRNSFYTKKDCLNNISRICSLDIYSYAFFDTEKIRQTIPKIYSRLIVFSLPTIRHTLETAWNLEHRQVDFFNIKCEWTLSPDFAIITEYRHRGPYSWRKVDEDNFFLDVFHSEEQLRRSPLSDRRDTLLLHFFYRFHPNWICEFSSRQGWNRFKQPSYLEFEIDLLTTIQTAWHLKLSFQHRENDNRFAVYLNIGIKRPEQDCQSKACCYR